MARDFDREWSTGYWDYMRGLSHVSRYGLLTSLLLHCRERPAVLDAGCGEGTLAAHLNGRADYLGFDVSPEAIARAAQACPDARFAVASVAEFQTEEKFDAVVFNAILYLFDDKRGIVARYAKLLKPGGILVIENHTTFRAARDYFRKVGELQDSKGWEKNQEELPLDWLGPLFEDYRHEAHYTLLNWSVANSEFPCRHIHLFRLREKAPPPPPPRAGFGEDSAPYVFGTESMGGVLEALKVEGRSVLTVLGGADQLLNFVCAGAREVVGFDISRAAAHLAELKLAALRTFDRSRYLALFLELQNGPSADAKGALSGLFPQLSPAARHYFQLGFETGLKVKVRILRAAKLTGINPYLQSDEAYLRTRAGLSEGVFLTADLFTLREQLNRRFDVVYAANVLDFNRSRAAEGVASLWPLVEQGGCICSYEFASHPQRDGEYGPGVLQRHAFDGPVYGGRDSLAVLRREPQDPWKNWLDGLGDDLAPIGQGGQSSHLYRAGQVVLRAPRPGTKVDAQASFRSHRLLRTLALRAGAPHLALPAALVDTPEELRAQVASPQMVATPLLPADHRNAHSLPAKLLSRVGEEDRLAAALLCVLTAQCDAVLKNVFVAPDGKPVLLDLDTCLGRPVWWGPASRTCFAPGGALAYSSPQDGFAALPEPHAELIREVLRGSDFGLLPEEMRALKACARAIFELGLTRASTRPLPEPRG
jgi:SAM-dependent methyltransferase